VKADPSRVLGRDGNAGGESISISIPILISIQIPVCFVCGGAAP